MGGYDLTRKRGSNGELFMGINPTHIPEIILSLCITFYLCKQAIKKNCASTQIVHQLTYNIIIIFLISIFPLCNGFLQAICTGSNPTQSTIRRRSDLMDSPIIWSLKPSKSPCFPDRAYHMGETNLWIFELKGDAGKESTQSRSSRRLGRKASRSVAIRGGRNSRRSNNPEAAREAMASSSGSKPTTEERLAALEANMQHLRHQLNNLDDFL
jgi:hypothetical protein